MPAYYTLQIHYSGGKNDAVEERKDLECPNDKDFFTWMRDIRKSIFESGIQIQTAPGSFEFISPFRINTVYLLKQDRKYKT